MKIAVLSIDIGRYVYFWKELYESSEKFFLSNHEKDYYVFSDSKDIYGYGKKENIFLIEQSDLGWPDNTLMRFHLFNTISDLLKKYDYIFFMNANLLFIQEIPDTILPVEEGLVFVKKINSSIRKNKFPYEKRTESTAYVSDEQEGVYVRGGFFGGKTHDFLEMSKQLAKNIDIDRKKGIIAVWHDESHLCRYVIHKNVKLLPAGYLYPEGWVEPCKMYVLVRRKKNEFMRYGKKFTIKMLVQDIRLCARNLLMKIFIMLKVIKIEE